VSVVERLRRATVQICGPDERIRGTAFVISSSPWRVVTCQHVAAAAGLPVDAPTDTEVTVRFPEAKPAETRPAVVAGRPDPYEDDVVLLELKGAEPPMLPEHVLSLEAAAECDRQEFVSYGFRNLDKYAGGIAEGKIQGRLPTPEGFKLACEPLQISSAQIDGGMSGAALVDAKEKRVVAIVSEAFYARDEYGKDRDTAWAIDGAILTFLPPGARPGAESLPQLASPQIGTSLAPAGGQLGGEFHFAPPPPRSFIGRGDALQWLDEQWRGDGDAVLVVQGPAGVGKSTVVRQWLEQLGQGDGGLEGAFWWSFDQAPSLDEFFDSALGFFSGGKVALSMARGPGRALLLAAYLTSRRAVLVLDDVDNLDAEAARALDELVDLIGSREERGSLCVITSRERRASWGGRVRAFELEPLGEAGVENPLLARLVAHSRDPQGDAARISEVPEEERLQTFVRQRMRELRPEERRLLSALALMRYPLPVEWLPSVEAGLGMRFAEPGLDTGGAAGALFESGLVRTYEGEPPVVSVSETIASAVLPEAERAGDLHRALAGMWWEHRYRSPHTGEREWRPAGDLQELRPAIETVYHLCEAGDFEVAYECLWDGVYRYSSFALVNQLGEWAVDLDLVRRFFAGGDLEADPVLEDGSKRSILLTEVALDLRELGRPREALGFFDRAIEAGESTGKGHFGATALCRKSETMLGFGDLEGARRAAEEALAAAVEDEDKESLWYSHATLALPVAFQGGLSEALEHYSRAREIRAPQIMAGPRATEELFVRWWAGETEGIGALYSERWQLADWEKDRENLAMLYRFRGEYNAAHDPAPSLRALAEAVGHASKLTATRPLIEALIAFSAVVAAVATTPEELGEAERYGHEAIRLIDSSGWTRFEPRARIALAHAALGGDRFDQADRHLQRAAILAQQSGNELDLALVERLRNDPDPNRYSLAPPAH